MPIFPASTSSAIGVLMSGGLDSAILTGQLLAEGREVQPFYVRCGLAWESIERAASERFLEALRQPRLRSIVTLDLPLRDVYGDHWSITGEGIPSATTADAAVFLPGRNAILLIKAAIWCQLHGIGELALAPLAGNPFGDATDEFFAAFEAMAGHLGGPGISIQRPFRKLRKVAVMQLGKNLPLELTFSCINPQGQRHCGACNKCAERQQAFREAQLADPTEYACASSDAPARPAGA